MTTSEDRIRMLENRCRKLEAELAVHRYSTLGLLRALDVLRPGAAEIALEFATKQSEAAIAGALAVDGASHLLDALIDEFEQQLGLPAND